MTISERKMEKKVNVIGAGLAGSEAALFLANHGVKVRLYEMKPKKLSPAHKMNSFAELVCSNSLKSTDPLTASGLLKAEMKALGSSLLSLAEECSVPSGSALSVDRELFSQRVTERIRLNENIEVVNEEYAKIDESQPTIIASGPLTSDALFNELKRYIGDDSCFFYDAVAPIVTLESIDMSKAFWGNRYSKGSSEGDYLNAPMNKEEYLNFYSELISAETAKLKEFEKLSVFEGCMPIEVMAKRGVDGLRFGPLKPVGLEHNGEKFYAVVQLRKENAEGSLLNLVGFQTNLTFGEQKRVFGLIPALKNAEFVRYGVMHRNSYINAPKALTACSQLKEHPNIFIAGQLSGVEGYVESMASGLYSAINMLKLLEGKELTPLSPKTCLGAIYHYITNASAENFQPMNANYGIIECDKNFRDKKEKKQYLLNVSNLEIEKFICK